MRARYEHLIAHPQEVEALLHAGAAKARAVATPLMARLRQAVGLRSLDSRAAGPAKTAKVATASFKQYREKDGQFYFKLVDAKGAVLLQSLGFESPKHSGVAIAQIKQSGLDALGALRGHLADGAASAAVLQAALDSLQGDPA
jgi:tryptophanyl-tRNA synthetase